MLIESLNDVAATATARRERPRRARPRGDVAPVHADGRVGTARDRRGRRQLPGRRRGAGATSTASARCGATSTAIAIRGSIARFAISSTGSHTRRSWGSPTSPRCGSAPRCWRSRRPGCAACSTRTPARPPSRSRSSSRSSTGSCAAARASSGSSASTRPITATRSAPSASGVSRCSTGSSGRCWSAASPFPRRRRATGPPRWPRSSSSSRRTPTRSPHSCWSRSCRARPACWCIRAASSPAQPSSAAGTPCT